MKKPLFIVFEGLDGSGKTTVSERVAEEIGAVPMTTPPPEFSCLRSTIDDRYKNNVRAARLFYASTVVHASSLVRDKLNMKTSVVLDRYLMSTMAYDKSPHDSGICDNLWIDVVFRDILVPDIVFYIVASADVRRKRICKRKNTSATDEKSINKSKKLEQRYDEIIKTLGKRAWQTELVKNEELLDDCVESCMAKIRTL